MPTNQAIITAIAPVYERMATTHGTTSAAPDVGFDPKCASHHFGLWMIEPGWFKSAVNAVRDGIWPVQAAAPIEVESQEEKKRRSYVVVKGVAIIPIAGPMMKARSKFGGTSTVDVRTAIRQAVNDDSVSSILILIDSPGGTVAGTESLAQDIANADQQKPTYAHIEDLGASAAYYAASQARRITASPTSLVGSLGTMMALDDFSKSYELKGIKTYVVSSGGMKGAGTEGTEVTAEQLAYFQGLVDAGTEHFKAAVKRGRKMSDAKVDALFDGRVHDAAKAKSMDLIDAVVSIDSLMVEILAEIDGEGSEIQKTKKTKQTALTKNATRLGDVAMNPDELLANVAAIGEPPSSPQIDLSAPGLSPRGESLPVTNQQETLTMSTQSDTAPAQVPAAVTSGAMQGTTTNPPPGPLSAAEIHAMQERIHTAGAEEGEKRSLTRFKAIMDACPGKPDMAATAFIAGQTPDAVKLAYEAANAAAATYEARIAQMQEDNRRAVALAATGGYAGGVGMILESNDDDIDGPMTPEVAKEAATREWDRNPAVRKGFSSKTNYVSFRSAQLRGQFGGKAVASA